MNYETNISALQQQMMRGADILARESGKTKEYRSDGYVNMLNKYGTARDSSSHYVFQADAYAMDSQLTELYEGNGLFTKIIDRPAEEAVKRGFDLGIKDQDVLTYLSDKLDDLDWEQNASQALKWTRLYGGALMVMIINDGRNIWEPVDWKSVKGIEELRVYERPLVNPDYHSIYRTVSNDPGRVSKAKFGMPQYYQVSSIYGTFRVHESRCLVFRNGVLPENSLNTQYRFWGIPEFYRIKKNLQETYTAHGNGVKLLDRCVQAIYKMRNLSNLLLTEGGEDQVLKRLNAIDMARGILNTMIIDADGEDYDFKQMSMSGVRDIIDSTCTMLSAVTDIPQTILFGRSPAGMNSTGEGDTENYYNMVEGLQKLNLKANGRTLLDLIFTEGVVTGRLQQKPEYKTGFEKLWSLSEKEQAELDKQKADTEYVKAQTAQIYVELQVLNPEEIRAGLSKDDTFYVEDLLSDEELDFTGTETATAVGTESVDDILEAIESGTEDTTVVLPEDTMTTDAEGRNIHTTDDILESIEAGTEDCSAVLMCDPEIDEIIEEIEGETEKEDEEQPQDLDVGVGVLVIKDGKILVAERSDGKGWCGPGGHMQAGEDTMQAALRETYEEFDILPREFLPMDGFTITLDGEQEINQFFCTDFEGEPMADENEMHSARFVSLEELQELPLFPPFAEAVEKFLEMIQPKETQLDRADFDESKVKREKNGRFGVKPDSDKGKSTTKPLTNPKKSGTMNASLKGTVTSKGIEIKHISPHANARMKQRKISEKRAIKTLTNPDRVYLDTEHGPNRYKYERNTLRAIVDHSTGTVVSVMIFD